MQPFLRAALLSLFFCAGPLWAQGSAEKSLPLDGSIAPNGRAVELRWFEAQPPRVGSVMVRRRLLGETGAVRWQQIGPVLGPVMRFTDETTSPGVAYEYQVMRTARDIVDVGYWTTGVQLPAVEARGSAYVIVDRSVSADLTARLARFERDLIGDGWRVQRLEVPRGDDTAPPVQTLAVMVQIRNWLKERYFQDPFGKHAVILVGHVPIPLSGKAAPDGHGAVPLPSDLFYADMDGTWRATPEGLLAETAVPGDFIEMQIGRIDFAPVSGGARDLEIDLIRAYFDKNHHWRMGFLGDLENAYGQSNHLFAEQYALKNIVGPKAVVTGGHHDAGERRPWLWGVDFGEADGKRYATDFSNKAVFAINFGSHKHKIHRPFNGMAALLAQPWYPLAVGWGGRPSWRLHHMALGGTIGDVHMRTVNNGRAADPYRETMDYFPTGTYLWRNPVWVNLLGDPTLRAFMLAPASRVVATPGGSGMRISWTASPDPDVIGYKVWRRETAASDFIPMEGGALISGLSLSEPAPLPGAEYMVRAYGLKNVYAGSFFTLSQGAFSTSGPLSATAEAMTLRTAADQPVALPEVFSTTPEGRIHAFIEGPRTGRLARRDTGWTFTPAAGFTGTVALRFSVSNAGQTGQGKIKITVAE